MDLRQAVAPGLPVELNDATGGHRSQPFADVALVAASALGPFLAPPRFGGLQRPEPPGTVADRLHQPSGRLIGHGYESAGKFILGPSPRPPRLLHLRNGP